MWLWFVYKGLASSLGANLAAQFEFSNFLANCFIFPLDAYFTCWYLVLYVLIRSQFTSVNKDVYNINSPHTIMRNGWVENLDFWGDPEKLSTGTDFSHLNICSVYSLLFAVHFYNDVAISLLNWIVVFISIRSVAGVLCYECRWMYLYIILSFDTMKHTQQWGGAIKIVVKHIFEKLILNSLVHTHFITTNK